MAYYASGPLPNAAEAPISLANGIPYIAGVHAYLSTIQSTRVGEARVPSFKLYITHESETE
jgi:hypothetical protein